MTCHDIPEHQIDQVNDINYRSLYIYANIIYNINLQFHKFGIAKDMLSRNGTARQFRRCIYQEETREST